MRKLLSLISVLTAVGINVNYSHSTQYWIKTYGGAGDDNSPSIQQTTDGGFVVGGSTSSFGASGSDILIMKLDNCGEIQWQQIFNRNENDVFSSIRQTIDGGYIIASYTGSGYIYGGSYDAWVLKLDRHGNVSWQKTYGTNENFDFIYSIQQTSDGGYVAVGTFQFSFDVEMGIWVLKLNSIGDMLWQKGFSNRIVGKSIQQTSDGGYVVLGATTYVITEPIVIKLDSNGEPSWKYSYSISNPDMPNVYATSIQQTSDEGYIVTYYYGDTLGLLKFDSNGSVSWARNYSHQYGFNYKFSSIQQTTDGGYVVSGHFVSSGKDALVVKYDGNGNITWQKTYGGSDEDYASSIQQTMDGGYIVAGATYSFGVGNSDMWVLKLDSNGNIPDCNIAANGSLDFTENALFWRSTCCSLTEFTPNTITSTDVLPQDVSVEILDVCSSGIEDYDCDDISDGIDNCPYIPNGPNSGSCVKLVNGVFIGTNTTCVNYGNCEEDETCEVYQLDTNENNIGDACECYADCNCDTKIDLADLVLMKGEFLISCPPYSCLADCNDDNAVNLADLVIMKEQFLRSDCPVCP